LNDIRAQTALEADVPLNQPTYIPYFPDHKTYLFPGKYCIKFTNVLWSKGASILTFKESEVPTFAGGIMAVIT
jgi:hypothetical protein